MTTNTHKTPPTDLVTRVFNKPLFKIGWFFCMVGLLVLVGNPLHGLLLVCWVYGWEAYFLKGIRVVHRKPTNMFSNGDLVPGFLDSVTRLLELVIILLVPTLLLAIVLGLYERFSRRYQSQSL